MWQRGLCSSDGVEDLELRRFSWILWVLQCNQDPHKERETQEVRVRAEDVTEAEAEVLHFEDGNAVSQGMRVASKKLGKPRKHSPLGKPPEGTHLANTLMLDF